MGGKRGIVAAAVLRVEDQRHIQHLGLQLRVLPVGPQHQEEILRQRQPVRRVADKQRLPFSEMPIGVIGIDGDHGQFGDQFHTLAQHIAQRGILRARIVRIQRQHTALHRVHDARIRRLHHHIPHEPDGEVLHLIHDREKELQFPLRRQLAK